MPSATRPCCPVEGKLAAWPEGQVSRRPHTAPKVGEFDLESKDQKWWSSGQVARKGTPRLKLQTHVYIYICVKYMKILIYTYLFIYTVHMLAADSSLALRIFIVMLLSLGCCWHKATSYCRNLWTYIQLASYSTGSSIGTRPPHNAASVARVTTNDGCTAGASDAPGTIFTFLRSERSETEIKYPVQV